MGGILGQSKPPSLSLLFLSLIGCLAMILLASLPTGREADIHPASGPNFTLTSH